MSYNTRMTKDKLRLGVFMCACMRLCGVRVCACGVHGVDDASVRVHVRA